MIKYKYQSNSSNIQRKNSEDCILSTSIVLLLSTQLLIENDGKPSKNKASKVIIRKRAKIENIEEILGDNYFRRSYRMSSDRFNQLVSLLKPFLPPKNRLGPNGPIPIEIELSIALRYFAGGSPYDLLLSHGVSHSTIFNSIWRIVHAINECESLRILFPSDHNVQRQIAAGFKAKSQVGFDNCVGAIDGLLIWTEKPSEKAAHEMRTGSKAFFCGRKGKFGYNLQAVADSDGRFLSVWLIHPASSSDFISFIRSKLYLKLNTPGFLAEDLVIFGDNAYVSTNYMVTPYKNIRAGPKDDFNFFHSQLRINIERAFGMLVHRWGILRRPMSSKMGSLKQITLTMALCSLHNFCLGDIGNGNSQDLSNNPANETFYDESLVVNNVDRNLLHGSEHFDDITDEEILSEQKSAVRLKMRKQVERSGLHRSVVSLQNRNN
jgi:hypothetical protein